MNQFSFSLFIALFATAASAAQAQTVDAQDGGPRIKVIVSAINDSFRAKQMGASDSALLLSETPGYSVAQAGGLSGLPVANGLADDRLKIRIDGMEITSACANHMNAPLSYVDPSQVGQITVVAGVTPVSAGGDSIGGTITVKSAAPEFATSPDGTIAKGKLAFSGRSVNDAINASLAATYATDKLSLGYSAALARGHSYESGDGERILGSMYKSENQSAVLSFRTDGQQLTLRAGRQHIPYQGFPNQYMDMTHNLGRFANIGYAGKFEWGDMDASAYWQSTDHEMGFFSPERRGNMPMVTHGRNAGYALKAEMPSGAASRLRLGHEYHTFRLDDFWPAVPGSMMMGPQTYLNINDGQRDRLAFYGEAETRHGAQWSSLLGARWEKVTMDTGNVQPYASNMMNMKDAAAAAAFNARSHRQRDNNLDLTALARFDASASTTYELAAARKTRSPNLYERYSWGRGIMAMTMTNWFGDGNGYVGSIDLKPETAYTFGLTVDWHGGAGLEKWSVKLNPYFNRVQDYVDVDVLGTFNPYMKKDAKGALLRFANHDAKLYGLNLSWSLPLARNSASGTWKFNGNAAYARGKRTDGGDLYHIMPPNALLTLEHSNGAWSNAIEARLVAPKRQVDTRRFEPETAGYALLNARSSYRLKKEVQLSAGVSNLLDKAYADPLGGVYLSGLRASSGAERPLPGYGRSVDIGLSIGF